MSDPIFTEEELAAMSPEDRLSIRMDETTGDTFDKLIVMLDQEVDSWIDLGVTDADALKYAESFVGRTELGTIFSAFLRYVPVRRAMRLTFARVDAVVAKYGWPEHGGYSFDKITELFDTMGRGES